MDILSPYKVLKIMPVQKQTHTGQQTRFKAFVTTGDYNGRVALDAKCSKAVASAIQGAIILAKFPFVPVWTARMASPILSHAR
jgi:small subunit ribosomal protein S2e